MLITPSNFVKNDVAQYANVNPDKIIVTYEAADKIQSAPEPLTQLAGQDFLLYVGRPTPHKNLRRAVGAFAKVRQIHPNLQFVLAGKFDTNYQRLYEYAEESLSSSAEHQNKNSIKGLVFTDFVSEGQLRWLYENARAYVFPSLSEGFGLPGLEAMAHGLPVVSSNATCLPEIYKDGALYFDPQNTDDMAAKISQLLDDPQLQNTLKAKGTKVAAGYSWQRMAEQTLQVYNSILKSK